MGESLGLFPIVMGYLVMFFRMLLIDSVGFTDESGTILDVFVT